jgi:SAM-dependent methyltransferase
MGISARGEGDDTLEYTKENAKTVDAWVRDGWKWGKPITHEQYEMAKRGDWSVVLTPRKPVPRTWFGELRGSKVLGLASAGGQQMPVFAAAGAICTVLDYSDSQLASERIVAQREGYPITIVKADMTKPLPFPAGTFDLIFHPVSNCYVEDVVSIWKECHRILKDGGVLLAGFDNGVNFAFDDSEKNLEHKLPFNPLKDPDLYARSVKEGWGIQFSHTIEEEIGGQLKAGFILEDIYHDINDEGPLADYCVPTFYATKARKVRHPDT